MGRWNHAEHEEDEQLTRIADALDFIGRLLAVYLPQPQPIATGVNGMSLPVSPVAPGTQFTGTYTAVDAAGNTLAGPIAFTSSDSTLLTVTGDGSVTGVSVVTCDAVAAGSPILTASFTNADGSVTSVGTNNPFTVTIAAATDNAVAVNGV
jgi:hypothetical protein